MRTEQEYLAAVDALYEAAIEPALWDGTIQVIASAFGASKGIFISHQIADDSPNRHSIAHGIGLDPEGLAMLARGDIRDEWAWAWAADPLKPARLPLGVGSGILPLQELKRTGLWHHLLAPSNVVDSLFIPALGTESVEGYLTIQAHQGRGLFEESDLEFARRLMPHVGRALQVALKLADATISASSQVALLERLKIGALVVDAAGHVSSLNEEAETLLRPNSGLSLKQRRLEARQPHRAWLEAALARATSSGSPASSERFIDGDATGLVVQVVPLPCSVVEPLLVRIESNRSALVLVTDPAQRRLPSMDTFGAAFALTPKQSQILLCLLQNGSVSEAGDSLELKRETVRWHLKQIFAKTETSSQAELLLKAASFGVSRK